MQKNQELWKEYFKQRTEYIKRNFQFLKRQRESESVATFASGGRNFQQRQNPEFASFKRDREHRNQSREWITDDEGDGNKHLRFPR